MMESLVVIYELCISMLTALLGLAYPLFCERISNIDEKYKSRRISNKFKREHSYVCFNILIIVSICFLFIVPFVLIALNKNVWTDILLTVQGILAFILSMCMIRLYFLILDYNDPERLFDKIRTNKNEQEKIEDLQVMAEFTATDEIYIDLFYRCMQELMKSVDTYQKNNLDNDKKKTYPEYIVQVLNHLMSCSAKEKYHLLSKSTEIVDMLYNSYIDFPVTDQVYGLMWSWLNKMVEADKGEWLKMYWRSAQQYYSFKLQYGDDDKQKEAFKEFHLMVCVMLLVKEKYGTLKYVLYYTNSLPAKYPLVPSTYRDIFRWYRILSDKNKDLYLLKYVITGQYNGAGEENRIEGFLMDFIVVLLVRLFTVDDYNITYSNPFELPDVGSTKEENELIVNILQTLKDKLKKLNTREIELININPCNVENLLDKYIDACKRKISDIEDFDVISERKRKFLKETLVVAVKTYKVGLPSAGKHNDNKVLCCCEQQVKLNKELILEGYEYISFNLAESLIHALNVQMREYYCYHLLFQKGGITLSIPYRDCAKVLSKLCLDNQYIIIALGLSNVFFDEIEGFVVNDGVISFDNSEVIRIPYSDESLVIMKKEQLPYCKLIKNDNKLKAIEENQFLYSNIDAISVDDLVLIIRQWYELYKPVSFKFLRLKISYKLSSDNVIVSNVKTIKEIIE